MTAWDKMSEAQLRAMVERSIPAMNQAGNLMGSVPSMDQWALIADGNRAREELARRREKPA